MREQSKLRKIDVSLSDEVYSFLDKTFYQLKGIEHFERVTDRERQIQGIDTIFEYKGYKYLCDEKCAVRHRNLKTYSLELSFINKNGDVQDGWLVSDNEKNNSFLLIWINEDSHTSIDVALVKRNTIIQKLSELGWSLERLKEKSSKIRKNPNENLGNINVNGCKFAYSEQLVEKPINVLLPKQTYLDIADFHWSVTLPNLTT